MTGKAEQPLFYKGDEERVYLDKWRYGPGLQEHLGITVETSIESLEIALRVLSVVDMPIGGMATGIRTPQIITLMRKALRDMINDRQVADSTQE